MSLKLKTVKALIRLMNLPAYNLLYIKLTIYHQVTYLSIDMLVQNLFAIGT